MKNISYCKILGLPMWIQMATQPNLSFAVNLLFCFMSNPRKVYWKAMKHMLTYIKETIDYEITYYHRLSLQPIGFVDSDYTNNYDIRWSIDEHVFL